MRTSHDPLTRALTTVQHDADRSLRVTVSLHDRVDGWMGRTPVVVGPMIHATLVAGAVAGVLARGMLTPSTTVGECVPLGEHPADIVPSDRVDGLLRRLGTVAAAPMPAPGALAALLGCILSAATGSDVLEVVTDEVLRPSGMERTGPRPGLHASVPWLTSTDDLRLLTVGPAWNQLQEAGVLPPIGVRARQGIRDPSAGLSLWRYPAHGVSIALHGPLSARRRTVAVLDEVLTGAVPT